MMLLKTGHGSMAQSGALKTGKIMVWEREKVVKTSACISGAVLMEH